MKKITTFPKKEEFEKAKNQLDLLGLEYEVITPSSAFCKVGIESIVVDQHVRASLYRNSIPDFVDSGWVDYRLTQIVISKENHKNFSEDVFGEANIMVLSPCYADETKIRIIAHISGDMEKVLPYMNSHIKGAFFNPNLNCLTFKDGYRIITLYPRKIAVAKADEIIDAWRVLELIRCKVNETWLKRNEIKPSYEMKHKPPALEIYKRLPKINCKQCGENTCLSVSMQLWNGLSIPSECKPVFEGEYIHLKDALLQICSGIGVQEAN